MDFRDAAVIARDQPVQDFRQPQARAAVDPPHDAEVDRGDPIARQREQISLMQVGMEKAVRDRLPQKGVHQYPRQHRQIIARLHQRGAVRQLDPVDPFDRQHAAGGTRPIDRRNDEIRLRGHAFGQFGRRRRLAREVQVPCGPALEGFDDEARLQACDLAAHRLDLRRGPFIGVDRAREILFHAGTQHLDRDDTAVGGARAMHLRDRRGTDRDFLDMREQRVERSAEALAHHIAYRLERHRRDGILQPQQVAGGCLADDIGAGGERLAQFDRGRPQRLKSVGVARHLGHTRAQPCQSQQAPQPQRRVRITLDPAQRTVTGQRSAPFQKPPGMDDRRGQIFQPLWIATSPPSIGSTRVCTKPASPIMRSNAGISGKRRIDSIR